MSATHTCIECQASFQPQKAHARFCSTPCRKAFNNRRALRGALLYDAFMSLRYERGWAKAVGLWSLICRLAAEWVEEDERAGRQSFVRPDDWVRDNAAWLRGKKFTIAIGRNTRR